MEITGPPLPPGAPDVRFGGIPALAIHVSEDRTKITATSPRHWAGPVEVSVRVAEATASLSKAYDYACPDFTQSRLLLLVVLAGGLGGVLHALRSLFYFIGNRELKVSWVPSYFAMPLTGAAMGTVFFLVFIAGFFDPQGGNSNFFMMVGVSALVGMFSPEAAEKLKQISTAILTDARKAKDAVVTNGPVTVTAVDPPRGPAKGQVVVKGSGFLTGASVLFDGMPGNVVDVHATAITVETPQHAAGKVAVEVKNTNGTSAKREDGFEYT